MSKEKGDEMAKFKPNLQAMRRRAGFKSAREFALHAGVPVDTYTAYEQGKINLTLLQAWEFADLLGCTLDELAGRKPPTASVDLSEDEQAIIDAYRSDRHARRTIDHAVSDYIEDLEDDAREKKEVI